MCLQPLTVRHIMITSGGYMAEPANGQVRATINPPDIYRKLTAIGVSTTILVFVAVVLGFFTRLHVTKNGIHLENCGLAYPRDSEPIATYQT